MLGLSSRMSEEIDSLAEERDKDATVSEGSPVSFDDLSKCREFTFFSDELFGDLSSQCWTTWALAQA